MYRNVKQDKKNRSAGTRGQLLIEIGIAIGIIATLSAMTATLIVVAQRSQVSARRQDAASALLSEAYSILRSMIQSDSAVTTSGFNRVYCPPYGVCPAMEFPVETGKGAGSSYRPVLVGSHWELESGSEIVSIGGVDYTRFVTIENVCRDASGDIASTYGAMGNCGGGETDDPSTQKLTVTMQAPNMQDLSAGLFTTRWRNDPSGQTSWGGGEATPSSLGESVVHFAITVTEMQDPELVRGLACKTDEVDGNDYSCPGGAWAVSVGWHTITGGSGVVDLYYTPGPGDAGVQDAYLFACDDEGACSGSDYQTFTVN